MMIYEKIKFTSYIIFLVTAMAAVVLGLVMLWFEIPSEFNTKLLTTFIVVAIASILVSAASREMANKKEKTG